LQPRFPFKVEVLLVFQWLEGRQNHDSLSAHGDDDPQNPAPTGFTQIGPALLAIDNIEPNIQRVAENDLFCFFRLNFVFCDMPNIRVVPIKKQMIHGFSNLPGYRLNWAITNLRLFESTIISPLKEERSGFSTF